MEGHLWLALDRLKYLMYILLLSLINIIETIMKATLGHFFIQRGHLAHLQRGLCFLLGLNRGSSTCLANGNTLHSKWHKPQMPVVLTAGAAASGLSSANDKPDSQSQDGPHYDQYHKNPRSRTQHHQCTSSQGGLCRGMDSHTDYLNRTVFILNV